MENNKPKSYNDIYLYTKVDYERRIIEYMSNCDEVDKKSEMFADIAFDVKRRQVTNSLMTVLNSDKVILLTGAKPLPKSFKVFMAKDIRKGNTGEIRVFIDVTEIMKVDHGVYKCNNIDVLIAYLVTAMVTVIYNSDSRRIISNSSIIQNGSEAFVDLFMFVIDHLKVNGFGVIRPKLMYVTVLYYNSCILGREINETAKALASKISKISPRDREITDLGLNINETKFLDRLKDINTFINLISEMTKTTELSVDAFIEKWIYLYGPSTHFATELFLPFCTMLTNTYCGVYLNNQKTIEKIVGGTNLVSFVNAIFKIGADSI